MPEKTTANFDWTVSIRVIFQNLLDSAQVQHHLVIPSAPHFAGVDFSAAGFVIDDDIQTFPFLQEFVRQLQSSMQLENRDLA